MHTGFCWNCWWWTQWRQKLVLHEWPADKIAIRCQVESGSLKTSESQATEIEGENTADRILWCKRPASSRIHSFRTDGHFYSLFGSYETLYVPHSSNLAWVPRTGQLEFAALQCAGTHCNYAENQITVLYLPLPPTHRIWLWPTFFCFSKSSLRWKAHFSRIFQPSKALALRSWRQSLKQSSPEHLTDFMSAAMSVYVEGWCE